MISKSPMRPKKSNSDGGEQILPPPGLLDSPEDVLLYYQKLGVSVDPSVDIVAMIDKNEELDLVYVDLGSKDAYIKKIDNGRFEIGVNKRHHPNRQKFSLAHEYAHYVKHRNQIEEMPIGEQILNRDGDRNSIESQANRFASELLMPEKLVANAFREAAGNLKGMANILGVSKEALSYRLENLGYRMK
ncbi:MAG: ImmA/IrrE family metallo-endopeptidase [Cohaesibacter sp.]|jgi:Zn-dependent peptidase ImmA (M78 family)|nr:ImmA/IrrE family metallo-endopeptidase [Cohaesibacter sp.]